MSSTTYCRELNNLLEVINQGIRSGVNALYSLQSLEINLNISAHDNSRSKTVVRCCGAGCDMAGNYVYPTINLGLSTQKFLKVGFAQSYVINGKYLNK